MSWVDIFYLTLVLCALSGFAVALAYYTQQDEGYRASRDKAEETAKPSAAIPAAVKPVAAKPAAAKILEHA